MDSNDRILNLDETSGVDVVLGGRHFTIQQQRFAMVQRVLAISDQNERAISKQEGEQETEFQERIFAERWQDTILACAYMLGVEEPASVDGSKDLAFIEHHLSIPRAIQIWEKWYEVNQINDFFVRGGRVLMKPWMVEAFQKVQQDALLEALNSSESETDPPTM